MTPYIASHRHRPLASLVAVLFCALVALSQASTSRAAENWPEFRGPKGDGSSDATGVPLTWSEAEHIRWKTEIHDRGWSSPVVWKNQIWLTTALESGHQMFVMAFDATTGKVIHDIKLFDVEVPSPIHVFNSYASPTPVVEDGRVYVHFGSYGTACLDTATGKTLWERRDLPCEHFRGPGSSPIMYGDLLIIHYDGFDVQYVVALDKKTGNTVWKRDRDVDFHTNDGDFKKSYVTPIVIRVEGKDQLISPCAKATLAYDPKTGEEIWRVRHTGYSLAGRPLYTQGLVCFSIGTPPELWAVRPEGHGDVTTSHVEWVATKHIGSKPSAIAWEDLIFTVSDGGIAACLEAKNGDVVWAHRVGGDYSASPILVDGRIYYFNQDGKTTVIKPGRKYEELAVNKLDDGFMGSAAITGKAFILRTRTSLYRIEE